MIVTVAFLPQAIRSYFGDGETLGMRDRATRSRSRRSAPPGSVRLAARQLDETFLVISGDALCDVDLSALVAFHKEKGAAVTIGLKSVENPLEFGIVVTDEDGRIERFLEKPSWGQVFSDTINTGIYVLEPEVLKHVPTDRPYDFSKELFPLPARDGPAAVRLRAATATGRTSATSTSSGRRTSTRSTRSVRLNIPGIRIRGNVWLGEGVEIDDLEQIEGPGVHRQLLPHRARATRRLALGALEQRRRCASGRAPTRSVIDASTHIGRSALIEGAIVGRVVRHPRARPHPRGRRDRRRGDDRRRER